MGFGGIGPGSLILILVIVILLFGTKKLRNIGSDLGGGLRNFRKAMKEEESSGPEQSKLDDKAGTGDVIEGEVTSKEKDKA